MQDEDCCSQGSPMTIQAASPRVEYLHMQLIHEAALNDSSHHMQEKGKMAYALAESRADNERLREELANWQMAARSIGGMLRALNVPTSSNELLHIVRLRAVYWNRLRRVAIGALESIADPSSWLSPITARPKLTGVTIAEVAEKALGAIRIEYQDSMESIPASSAQDFARRDAERVQANLSKE